MTGPPTFPRPMTFGQWGLLILLSLLWGGSFFFIAVAVKQIPPLTIVASRVSLAAAALLAATRVTGLALAREPSVWRAFFVMGALNNAAPYTLLVWAQSHIASGVASILNATTPLFTVVVAHFLAKDERRTPGGVPGVMLGIVGVSVMIGVGALQSLAVDVAAEAACLLAALSYAFAAVYGRRFHRLGVTPLASVTGMVCASSVILVPLALVVDRPWTLAPPSGGAIASILCLALVSTAVAYLLYFRLLASVGATNLTLVTFLLPVSAILLGAIFLGETLQARQIAGMALIGLGLAAIDGRLWTRLFRRLPAAPRANSG